MKIVVYTQRVEIVETYNERRDCADQRIAQWIYTCGFLPLALPNNVAIVTRIMTELLPSGIVLVGGNSLVKYGGSAPERDAVDKYLISWSLKNNTPLYGFCRGMQSILDFFQVELEDISAHVAVNHAIHGEICDMVNSFHNQACKDINTAPLEILAQADDGVIEAIKVKDKAIIGTMWHPEREKPFREQDILRLRQLVEYREDI